MLNTGTLKVELPSDREVRMTRLFKAPRGLVYDCLTKPELLKLWFGPHGWRLVECTVDLRVGGGWRYMLEGPGGQRMGMSGEIRRLDPPGSLAHIERFDDYPGESFVTTKLSESDGQTTMVVTVLAESKEIRDAVVASGMEHGAAESYDRLAGALGLRKDGAPLLIEAPEIVDAAALKVAKIHIVTPVSQIREVMGAGLSELRAVLTEQGITPAGPWLSHHLKAPGAIFDYEICIPVDVEVAPKGRVTAGEIPAARTARSVYRGNFDRLGQGWGQLMQWIEALPVKPADTLWEVYRIGPDDSPNPDDWRTELNRPLL
ncbi:MAG: SRPBCC domain-containing protein [Asticcacaulis sp.]